MKKILVKSHYRNVRSHGRVKDSNKRKSREVASLIGHSKETNSLSKGDYPNTMIAHNLAIQSGREKLKKGVKLTTKRKRKLTLGLSQKWAMNQLNSDWNSNTIHDRINNRKTFLKEYF